MLRANLATRPFYNERAVHVAIALAALLVAAITVLNVVRIVSLSRHNTELSARMGAEQAEAARLTTDAAAIRKAINRDELQLVADAAGEANALIDQRTFSWTEFFNHIESTLPPDVMLTSVHPSFEREQTRVSMGVLARRTEDVDELIERLESTGAFEEVLPAAAAETETGLKRVTLEGIYTGRSVTPETPAATAPAAQQPRPAGTGGRQ